MFSIVLKLCTEARYNEDPIEQDDLKCGEKFTNLSCKVSGDTTDLPMKIKAKEKGCNFFDHMSNKESVRVRFTGKASQEVTRP
jgi:hypothetical protein